MFQLDQQRATVQNVNVRAEKHGDESVIATDVNLEFDCSADALNQFDKGLTAVLFVKPRNGAQKNLEGVDELEGPALRFPGVLEEIRLAKECAGYRAQIVWGDLAGSINLALSDCRVHKFSAKAKQGGTVELRLQIQSRPDAPTIGQLAALIQKEVTVTLSPPAVEDEPASSEAPNAAPPKLAKDAAWPFSTK